MENKKQAPASDSPLNVATNKWDQNIKEQPPALTSPRNRVETVPAEDVEPEQLPPSLSQMKDLVNGCIPPLQTKGIKYGHLNIHSLVQKIDALRILLKNKPFDVISFNKTLCNFTVSDSEISIDGFCIFRRDRNRHGGGVAVYVSEKFKAKRRHDLESAVIENVWVEICNPHKSPCLVGSFYRPPKAVYDFNSEFEENVDRVSDVGMECIILGDFNYDFTPVPDIFCCNLLFILLLMVLLSLLLLLPELQTIAKLLLI